MSAKVIDLAEYRRKKAAEKDVKKLKGLGFPDDFSPFQGPDDLPEDFGMAGLFSGLRDIEFEKQQKENAFKIITNAVELTEADKKRLKELLDEG